MTGLNFLRKLAFQICTRGWLDAVLVASPDIEWQLLKKRLPRHVNSTFPTQHSKLRNLAPEEPEEITFDLLWDFETAVVDRAFVAAGTDESNLGVLIEAMGQLVADDRKLTVNSPSATANNSLDGRLGSSVVSKGQ